MISTSKPTVPASGIGTAISYDANIQFLLEQFYDAEKNITDDSRDSAINNMQENYYAFNMLGFTK